MGWEIALYVVVGVVGFLVGWAATMRWVSQALNATAVFDAGVEAGREYEKRGCPDPIHKLR